MSLESEDIMDVQETRKKKAKKWVKFKIDEKSYAEIERLFGQGNTAKAMRVIVSDYLNAVETPEDPRARATLEVLREFIPSNEAETEVDWETTFNIAKRFADGDYAEARAIIEQLKKENYIRNGRHGLRVRRRKFPDPVVEFLYGGG